METDHAPIQQTPALKTIELQLSTLLENEERAYLRNSFDQVDSLWSHSKRVAKFAEKIGLTEGADLTACRLAGLFHDAGKITSGEYHQNDTKEEDHSAQIFRELTQGKGLDENILDCVEEAILQMYQSVVEPSPLAKILFDADNLDKLGLLGVGNFFIKAGLRGRGLNQALLYRISVELTYARYASASLTTQTGKKIAARKADEMINFYKHLFKSLRDDDIYSFYVTEVEHDGLLLTLVESPTCSCGGSIERNIWNVPELKCVEIHVEYSCVQCDFNHELHFCRPRIT